MKHARSNAPSIAMSTCYGQMLNAMHVRTDGRTYGEPTHLTDEILTLATRACAYGNPINMTGEPAMTTQAQLDAARRGRETQRALTAERRAQRIADIEEDLALGIEPERIVASFGITPEALIRSLHRAGRRDLAARFRPTGKTWPARFKYSRGNRCSDCGQPCTNTATRCSRCANSRRAHEQWTTTRRAVA